MSERGNGRQKREYKLSHCPQATLRPCRRRCRTGSPHAVEGVTAWRATARAKSIAPKRLERRVIVYCKAHPDVKVIKAMDINIKQMRKEAGIKVEDER